MNYCSMQVFVFMHPFFYCLNTLGHINCLIKNELIREVFRKKGILVNFAKLTGKVLCQSIFFNKIASLRPATLLKKRL